MINWSAFNIKYDLVNKRVLKDRNSWQNFKYSIKVQKGKNFLWNLCYFQEFLAISIHVCSELVVLPISSIPKQTFAQTSLDLSSVNENWETIATFRSRFFISFFFFFLESSNITLFTATKSIGTSSRKDLNSSFL